MKKTFVYAVALAMTILSIYSCSNIEIATFEDCYKETAKISENCYAFRCRHHKHRRFFHRIHDNVYQKNLYET